MAGYDDGDSVYGDDDLDALPEDALDELENNAILFTQAQTQAAPIHHPPTSDYGDEFEDEDLDDAVVIDESRSTPAINHLYSQRTLPGKSSQQNHFRPPQQTNPNPGLSNRQDSNPRPPPPKYNQPASFLQRAAVPRDDSMRVEQGSAPSTESISELERLQRMVEEVICLLPRFDTDFANNV